jgi:CO/xanthine dehydrogenase FAD-binding subunit
VREAVTAALAGIEPMDDLHASADYRRRAAVTLSVRAVMDAHQSAHTRGAHAA